MRSSYEFQNNAGFSLFTSGRCDYWLWVAFKRSPAKVQAFAEFHNSSRISQKITGLERLWERVNVVSRLNPKLKNKKPIKNWWVFHTIGMSKLLTLGLKFECDFDSRVRMLWTLFSRHRCKHRPSTAPAVQVCLTDSTTSHTAEVKASESTSQHVSMSSSSSNVKQGPMLQNIFCH